MASDRLKVFSGTAGRPLADEICTFLGNEIGDKTIRGQATVGKFSDGEIKVEFNENIRGADVFVVNPTNPPGDNLLEVMFMVDAARRASARRVTLICSYLGYNRQDRKDRPRVPISASVVIRMLTNSGMHGVLFVDLHSEATLGAFPNHIAVDHVYGSAVTIAHLKAMLGSNCVVASPDKGGMVRAKAYARLLDQEDCVVCDKTRPRAGEVGEVKLIGDVEGKKVLLVDDMADTAGTLTAAAVALMEHGATAVFANVTHGLFSGNAIQRIAESPIKELVVTNTVWHSARKQAKMAEARIVELSAAPLLARAIRNIHDDVSISSLIL